MKYEKVMGLHLFAVVLLTFFFLSVINVSENNAQSLPQINNEDIGEVFSNITPIPVVFLGSYHMSNPGADQFNLESDDVLLPKRQLEIQEVVDLLKEFKPTKVAVEAPLGDSLARARYQAYLRDELELRRSEEEQIGFRLAKALGHQTIYPIDVKMNLNDEALGGLIEKNPQKFGPYMANLQKLGNLAMATMGDWLKNGTIREMLYKMNDPQLEKVGHQLYFYSFVPVVEGDNYAGADMVNTWYHRNLRIFSNLHQILEKDQERILVVYGQGHVPLLKQFARDSPFFKVVDVRNFLEE